MPTPRPSERNQKLTGSSLLWQVQRRRMKIPVAQRSAETPKSLGARSRIPTVTTQRVTRRTLTRQNRSAKMISPKAPILNVCNPELTSASLSEYTRILKTRLLDVRRFVETKSHPDVGNRRRTMMIQRGTLRTLTEMNRLLHTISKTTPSPNERSLEPTQRSPREKARRQRTMLLSVPQIAKPRMHPNVGSRILPMMLQHVTLRRLTGTSQLEPMILVKVPIPSVRSQARTQKRLPGTTQRPRRKTLNVPRSGETWRIPNARNRKLPAMTQNVIRQRLTGLNHSVLRIVEKATNPDVRSPKPTPMLPP